jgi:hypothetical protein
MQQVFSQARTGPPVRPAAQLVADDLRIAGLSPRSGDSR